jgi:hypothetical protein
MIAGEFPPSFTVDGAVKDTALIAAAMRESVTDATLMDAVAGQYRKAADGGHGAEDMAPSTGRSTPEPHRHARCWSPSVMRRRRMPTPRTAVLAQVPAARLGSLRRADPAVLCAAWRGREGCPVPEPMKEHAHGHGLVPITV